MNSLELGKYYDQASTFSLDYLTLVRRLSWGYLLGQVDYYGYNNWA